MASNCAHSNAITSTSSTFSTSIACRPYQFVSKAGASLCPLTVRLIVLGTNELMRFQSRIMATANPFLPSSVDSKTRGCVGTRSHSPVVGTARHVKSAHELCGRGRRRRARPGEHDTDVRATGRVLAGGRGRSAERVVHLPAGNIISQHNNRPVATAPAGGRPKPSGARLPASLFASVIRCRTLPSIPDIASVSR